MEEDFKRISNLIKYIENADYVDASQCFDCEDIEAIKKLLQENKASKEAINTLTNKLEKVVDDNKELGEEVEQYKMLHLKSVASRVCNDLKTSEKHKEDLEMLYAGCQEELKNSIPISVIQNKIDELNDYYKKVIYPIRFNWADVDITEFYDSQIELLQDLLDRKE